MDKRVWVAAALAVLGAVGLGVWWSQPLPEAEPSAPVVRAKATFSSPDKAVEAPQPYEWAALPGKVAHLTAGSEIDQAAWAKRQVALDAVVAEINTRPCAELEANAQAVSQLLVQAAITRTRAGANGAPWFLRAAAIERQAGRAIPDVPGLKTAEAALDGGAPAPPLCTPTNLKPSR